MTTDTHMLITAVAHTVYAWLRPPGGAAPTERDRGAVSLEQVLWFVASGVAVAVVAAIVWGRIRDEANAPIQRPSAP